MAKPEKSSAGLDHNLLAFAVLFATLVANFSPAIAYALTAVAVVLVKK